MKHSTAYNHLTRLKSKLESIHGTALIDMPTHYELLKRERVVVDDKALAKCPAWVRQSIGDSLFTFLARIQRERLVWLFSTSRGAMSYELLTDSERKQANSGDIKGRHYWLRNTTPSVGTIANPGHYRQGDTISRTYEVTDRLFN